MACLGSIHLGPLSSRRPYVEPPHEPIGIAPLRLALDDEGLTIHSKLVAGTRACNPAHPHLEHRRLGVNAGLAEADDRVGAPGDHPHADLLATGRRVGGIDPEGGERRIHRALEDRHQVRLPLIRGRVQIGSGFDCTCSITQRANCWSTACLPDAPELSW
jgi:hypothetical protein